VIVVLVAVVKKILRKPVQTNTARQTYHKYTYQNFAVVFARNLLVNLLHFVPVANVDRDLKAKFSVISSPLMENTVRETHRGHIVNPFAWGGPLQPALLSTETLYTAFHARELLSGCRELLQKSNH
jgi:hypothetical protein